MAYVNTNIIGTTYAVFTSVDKFAAWSAAFDHMAANSGDWHVQSYEVGLCGQPHGWGYTIRREVQKNAA